MYNISCIDSFLLSNFSQRKRLSGCMKA